VKKFDFFLSRRGSVAAVAREVADVLIERGYKVVVQDYDFPLSSDLVEAMHETLKNARDLVVLFTHDYESSPYTRKEFTSFEANRLLSTEERRLIILRCEEVAPLGLFAGNIYQDLVGVDDPEERRRRIIAAAEGQSQALKRPPRPFVGAPPRITNFTGREAELYPLIRYCWEGTSRQRLPKQRLAAPRWRAWAASARPRSRSNTHIDTDTSMLACGGAPLRAALAY
jgi:hypothetical protein